jgi:2'-5' RNA ligase
VPRLFVAIPMPEALADHLVLLQGGVPGARWETKEKLHLTLRFVGDVDGGVAARVADALGAVHAASFTFALRGVGHFPPRGAPRSLWAGVADPRPLRALHDKIERALSRIGLEPDPRNFSPHVTIGRLKGSPEGRVAAFIAHHALFASVDVDVDSFALMSSVTGSGGSTYRIERRYPLDAM